LQKSITTERFLAVRGAIIMIDLVAIITGFNVLLNMPIAT
jgi:hypothetical protein